MVSTETFRFALVGGSSLTGEGGFDESFRKSAYVAAFARHGSDACPSIAYPALAEAIDFRAVDICVLDFAATDGLLLHAGMVSEDGIRASLSDAVRSVLREGCLPAVLISPLSSVFTAAERRIRDIYVAVASEYKAVLFDGYKFFDLLAARGVPDSSLFGDDGRVHPDRAGQVGYHLLEGLLVAQRLRRPGDVLAGRGHTHAYAGLQRLQISQQSGVPGGASPGTDAAAPRFREIVGEMRVQLPIAAGEEIAGLALDWARSRGRVEIRGANAATLRLATPAGLTAAGFGVAPLDPPVTTGGPVFLTVAGDEGEGRLAFAGLITRRSAEYSVTAQLDRPLVVSDILARSMRFDRRDPDRWEVSNFFYDSLEDFLRREQTGLGLYTVAILNTLFDVLWMDRGSKTTVVFFHPAPFGRDAMKLPYFPGQGFVSEVCNEIHVSDPALYTDPPVPIGGCFGLSGCPVQEILPVVLRSILRERSEDARLIFAGPSVGGFAALLYSHGFPGSLCVVSNPQTIITEERFPYINMFSKSCFGIEDSATIRDVLENGLVSDLGTLYGRSVPNYVIYCQNTRDPYIEQHERPFLAQIDEGAVSHLTVIHGDWGDGHYPPPARSWARVLTEAVDWQGDWAGFLAENDFSELGTVIRGQALRPALRRAGSAPFWQAARARAARWVGA